MHEDKFKALKERLIMIILKLFSMKTNTDIRSLVADHTTTESTSDNDDIIIKYKLVRDMIIT